MKLNSFHSRILVAILALDVGAGVLFLGHQLEWIKRFDLKAVTSIYSTDDTLHEYDPVSEKNFFHPLIKSNQQGRAFQHIVITDDPERIFENNPPSALDYAVLLESLHNRGYRHVNIATRLSWDDDPGLLADGLDLKLALFDSAVVPLSVTRGPNASPIPAMLENAIIPDSQIYGDTRQIPLVNRLALPAHLTGDTKNVLAGFYRIESNPPETGRTAMLARWDDKGMIPSLELLTVMQAHRVLPSQVTIHCGKYIRLGKKGPVITIDSYGQTQTPASKKQDVSSAPLQATTLITQEKSDAALPSIAIIHAQGKRTESTNAIDTERFNQALAMTHIYPVPGNGTSHKRLPFWAELVALVDAASIVLWLRGHSRGRKHLGFALSAILTFPLLYAMMSLSQHWMVLSAPLTVLLIGWIIPSSNRRSTSTSPKKYHTTDSKPVVRA